MSKFSSRRKKSGSGASRQQGTPGLSPDDTDRLDSWLATILVELRPDPRHALDVTGAHPVSGSITFYDDGWYRHARRTYGTTALDLIAELKGGVRDPKAQAEALTWAKDFLARHPGTGTWATAGSAVAEAKTQWLAEQARLALQRRIAVPGTPVETYLTGRGITVRKGLEGVLGYWPDANPGKGMGAQVGVLVDHANPNTVLGVQVLPIDALGHPQLRPNSKKKARSTLFIAQEREARAPAVFYVPAVPAPEDTLEADPLAGKVIRLRGPGERPGDLPGGGTGHRAGCPRHRPSGGPGPHRRSARHAR
jgi:hypothetical protein